jgi:hypothetical protein
MHALAGINAPGYNSAGIDLHHLIFVTLDHRFRNRTIHLGTASMVASPNLSARIFAHGFIDTFGIIDAFF